MHSWVPLSPDTRREVLLTVGLPIVKKVAARVARRVPSSIALDDLVGTGTEGLLRAIASYDPARSERFEPYAEARIRGAILDALRAGDVLTRHARRRAAQVARATAELERTLGRAPSDEELAAALGLGLDEYASLVGLLDRGVGMTRAAEIDPEHVASADLDPAALYDQRELQARLAAAIAALPARMQQVLELYYREERTQAEIGRALGVTESRVCQILGAIAAQLRLALHDA